MEGVYLGDSTLDGELLLDDEPPLDRRSDKTPRDRYLSTKKGELIATSSCVLQHRSRGYLLSGDMSMTTKEN